MELRKMVKLESNWNATENLQEILLVRNSSGSVLDEPLADNTGSIVLACACENMPTSTPCVIHINCQRLKGYYLVSIQLTSGSRTVECYTGCEEEYAGTTRGTLVDSDQKLYQCEVELPKDEILQEVHLKLLSLHGRTEVGVSEICLAVMEDIGGRAVGVLASDRHAPPPPTDVRELLTSLPVSGAPPFLQSLASSLQLLQCSSSEMTSHKDMSKIVSLFKQLRPSQSTTATTVTTSGSNGDSIDEGREANGSELDADGETERDEIILLERRLQEYIDGKFLHLQKQMEEKFDKLRAELLSMEQ